MVLPAQPSPHATGPQHPLGAGGSEQQVDSQLGFKTFLKKLFSTRKSPGLCLLLRSGVKRSPAPTRHSPSSPRAPPASKARCETRFNHRFQHEETRPDRVGQKQSQSSSPAVDVGPQWRGQDEPKGKGALFRNVGFRRLLSLTPADINPPPACQRDRVCQFVFEINDFVKKT